MQLPKNKQCPVMRDSIDGLKYNETSDEWNTMCESFPCFADMYFPGYATTCRDTTIKGKHVVIQLWKGACPELLQISSFPGGIGGEVGIYERRAPPESSGGPDSIKNAKGPLPKAVATAKKIAPALAKPLSNIDRHLHQQRHPFESPDEGDGFQPGDLWYPAKFGWTLHLRLIHPRASTSPENIKAGFEETFFETPANFRDRTGYWCNRWMVRDSYNRYKSKHKVPWRATDFILEYTIDGVKQPRW